MHIEYWQHHDLNPDGTTGNPVRPEEGSVNPQPGVRTSSAGDLQTRSTVRDGLWLMLTTGRLDDGTMHGITLYFRDEAEMRAFEASGKWGDDHRKTPDREPPDAADYWKS